MPLVAAIALVAGVMLVLVGHLGVSAVEAARAQATADAVALAVAAEPAGDHGELAAGATVGSVEWRGDDVSVEVAVGGARAVASAHRDVPVELSPRRVGLAPAMIAALHRADQLLGRPVPISSGLRSRAQQERLWKARATNPYPVARPGTSRHESGLAVDIPRVFVATLLAVAPDAGLCRPLPDIDPIHFELCPR